MHGVWCSSPNHWQQSVTATILFYPHRQMRTRHQLGLWQYRSEIVMEIGFNKLHTDNQGHDMTPKTKC